MDWTGGRGFVLFVFLAEVVTRTYSFDLSSYPRWAVILGGTLIFALLIWIGMKVLKVALWILFFLVLIGGIAWALIELAG